MKNALPTPQQALDISEDEHLYYERAKERIRMIIANSMANRVFNFRSGLLDQWLSVGFGVANWKFEREFEAVAKDMQAAGWEARVTQGYGGALGMFLSFDFKHDQFNSKSIVFERSEILHNVFE